MRAQLPPRDSPPGPSSAPAAPRWRDALCLVIPLLVVGAVVLETAADILPSQGLVGPFTLTRILLVLAFAALIMAGARWSHFRTALDLPMVLVLVATAVATYENPASGGAPLRFLLTAVAFYYVTVGLTRLDPDATVALPLVVLAAVAIPTAVGIAQLAQHVPTTFYRRGLFGPVDSDRPLPGLQIRATGTFTNPNVLAAFLLLLGPYAALPAFAARRRGVQTVAGGGVVLAYVGVFITFSRAAVAAIFLSAAVVALVLLVRTPRWRHLSRFGWLALAVVVAALLGAGISGLMGRVSGRGEAFALATRALDGHLAAGVGPRRAGDVMNALGHGGPPYYHAHNLWLTWLVETGMAGFLGIALLTLGGLVAAARTAVAGRPLGIAGLPALAGFCVLSLVDNPANTERVAMSLFFVLALVMVDTRPGRLTPLGTDPSTAEAVDQIAQRDQDLVAAPGPAAGGPVSGPRPTGQRQPDTETITITKGQVPRARPVEQPPPEPETVAIARPRRRPDGTPGQHRHGRHR